MFLFKFAVAKRLPSKKILFPMIILGSGGILAFLFLTGLIGGEAEKSIYVTEKARVAPLKISATAKGQLDSMKNVTLSSSVEGSTTILMIVAEGTRVNAPVLSKVDGTVLRVNAVNSEVQTVVIEDAEGNEHPHEVKMDKYTQVRVKAGEKVKKDQMLAADLVCELDSAPMRDQIKQQQVTLTQAEAALAQARENLEIQRTQNESDIAAAELALKLAKLDYDKFLQGEYLQQVNQIDGEIKLAEEEAARARENYEFSKRIAKKGYKSQTELEADRIAVTKAEIAMRVAQEKLKVLENFTYTRTVAELEANALEFERELDRVKRKASSALAQFEADLAACTLTAEVEKSKYEKLVEQIAACMLFAPQSGEVVYANESGRRGDDVVIEEGGTVRERQAVINLPDLNQMKVNARIHESRINLVKAGLPVRVQVDAYPDETFPGVVHAVSSVPSSTNWYNRDLKEYDAVIRITAQGERVRKLRPGLTANLEIVSKQRENVLQVPMQAVVSMRDHHYIWVETVGEPERREIKIGESNDTDIEVLDGVKEGERVIMNPRTHFSKEISLLEEQLSAENATRPLEGDEEQPGQPAGPQAETPSGKAEKPAGENPQASGEQRPRRDPSQFFDQMDKNKDGKLTSDEVPEQLKDRLISADTDGDGAVSKAEWTKAAASRPAGRPQP